MRCAVLRQGATGCDLCCESWYVLVHIACLVSEIRLAAQQNVLPSVSTLTYQTSPAVTLIAPVVHPSMSNQVAFSFSPRVVLILRPSL